ncbi:MAG: hypothetical protein WCC84_11245 [Candidatus Cybelea sp.]
MRRYLLSVIGAAALAIAGLTVSSVRAVAQNQPQNLTCHIAPTSINWPNPGTMTVSIDGAEIGTFQFGPTGTTGFAFSCTPGAHTFAFIQAFANGQTATCTGPFAVNPPNLYYGPGMAMGPSGEMCYLNPVQPPGQL